MTECTRDEAIGIFNVLTSLFEEKLSVQGAMKIVKNKKIAKTEFDLMEETKSKFSETINRINTFHSKRKELCEKYCLREENGDASVIENNYQFSPENKIIFEAEILPLQEEYRESLDQRLVMNKEFEDLLKEKVDLPFDPINPDLLPTEMTPLQIEILAPILLS